ncbi:NADH dehydrogenase [ubiquinone] 1 beta subcomplex subunit 2, mitochondrial isoform X2 [Trachemys scripta elegans]|uniref:NADH dehydrogenase [ubiquinone] 1 beta subcomplex subunit 2, mitochondrial isoform X2 n=1 Tax=Trachemys scripta elegans TaxID=31138 RepID=UPI0015558F7D|nr:NADH dehydrogenase [ubiquinone] 1 beta subcomplex subunit 2, mitochondrial isoform X2 [Trachemys scripta elegans]
MLGALGRTGGGLVRILRARDVRRAAGLRQVTFLTQILRNGQMRNWGSLLMMKNRFTAQLPMCPVVGSLEKLKLWLLYNCFSKSIW